MFGALAELRPVNAQGEYYLTDLVEMYGARGLTVETVTVEDAREITGVNSRKVLADVTAQRAAARPGRCLHGLKCYTRCGRLA